MRLLELFKNTRKEFDSDKVISFHKCGHGLVMTACGAPPEYTSLIGYQGTAAFSAGSFYPWDVFFDWKEGWRFLLMQFFGGIVAEAWYCGKYFWDRAGADFKNAEEVKQKYSISYRHYLATWFDTHDLIQQHSDLLTKAAERLYKEKVLGAEFWEEEILLK